MFGPRGSSYSDVAPESRGLGHGDEYGDDHFTPCGSVAVHRAGTLLHRFSLAHGT